jgi:hypothetical protein
VTTREYRRLVFLALDAVVVTIPLICFASGNRDSVVRAFFPVWGAAALGVLICSTVFYNSERALSRAGFIIWYLALMWLFFSPTNTS